MRPDFVVAFEAFGRKMGLGAADFWDTVFGRLPMHPDSEQAFADFLYPLLSPNSLPREEENSTLSTMSASPAFVEARKGRPLNRRQHPFVAALIRENLTVLELAEDMKRPPSNVRSWYKHDKNAGYRPIPRAAAKYIQKRLGVPLEAWHRIAD